MFFAEAVAVGICLGLIIGLLGGGGGIIAVPALIGFFAMTFDAASTASLLVMIIGASLALIAHQRAGRVDWRTGIIFGSVGTVGALAGGRLALVIPDRAQQYAFAVVLVIAGTTMLRNARNGRRNRHIEEDHTQGGVRLHPSKLVPLATGVGLTTGIFGVGGGFITVPALVSAASMPVKRATATALVVIVINASVASIARIEAFPGLDLMVPLVVGAVTGAITGALWSRRLPSWVLSATFGTLTLLVSIYTVATA